jgi:hypothetical protein
MEEGDLVKSRSRPELGVGVILEISGRSTITVRWPHMVRPCSYSILQRPYTGHNLVDADQVRHHVLPDLMNVPPLEALAAQAEFIQCTPA